MALPVIAIIDIGKTNKKLLLFDEVYRVVFEKTTVLPETVDEDGFPCEDIQALIQFVKDAIDETLNLNYELRAINFSGYGASFVCIGTDGEPVCPLYNYLKPYPVELLEQFYATYGGKESFSQITASPVLAGLNSGMQLYRLKYQKPDVFRKVKFALHLPQFLSYLVTREACSELTSIGCHTNLWDFTKMAYHQWVFREKLDQVFPPIVSSRDTRIVTYRGQDLVVGNGLHDSSAALIPYLMVLKKPFVLISTGTWSISMNPYNNTPLSREELAMDCLCYLTYEGNPVKAARFFIGPEYEKQLQRLVDFYEARPEQYEEVSFDLGLGQRLMTDVAVSFAEKKLADFRNDAEAYHALMLWLARQQVTSLQLVLDSEAGIYVDGGFSRNIVFMNFLAMLLPGRGVYSATMPQGTALGCALAIHHAWNTRNISDDLIRFTRFGAESAM